SPIILLYTAGYRYDVATHTIKETGVITIDASPADAQVWINDIEIQKHIPIRLSNRAPGLYTLLITREGYLPWTMPLLVESEQTTCASDIVLYANALPTHEYDLPQEATQVTLSHNGRFVLTLIQKPGRIYEITLSDLLSEKES